ncbi:hypothetical protein WAB17_08930 [Parerythrobacter aurantius]|uniref:hypothetical protein n=1 Tax=Parerythrobacter aurantius TaxID=3127706 RepID=UPI003255D62F
MVALGCGSYAVTGDRAKAPAIIADPAVARANPLPDFSYAGYGFGMADIPDDPGTVLDVSDYGAIADDGRDDAKAVLKAIAAADGIEGRVTVRFPAGRFQIGEIIPIERSDLVLDGAGPAEGGTELYFPRPLRVVDTSGRQDELRAYLKRENKFQVEPDQNINFLFSEYSWSGGFILVGPKDAAPVAYASESEKGSRILARGVAGRQFDRRLTVGDTSRLEVGQAVQLQWFAPDGPDSALLKSMYGDIARWNDKQSDPDLRLNIGQRHWESDKRPTVAQTTRIAAIDGDAVVLGDPLMHAVSAAQPAHLAEWNHLSGVGIQDLKFTFPYSPWYGHHLEQGFNAIYMTGLFDGWARNLVMENADSAILTDDAASLTISKVTTTGNHKAHYAVHVGAVHNVLVQDLRVENPVIHPLSVNTRSTRSVFQRATVLRDGIIDQHSGSNHQNLFDQIVMSIKPRKRGGAWTYRLWEGGGAPYWKPGHGLMNTHWNIRLEIAGDMPESEVVRITSGLEGPGARIVGLHGNRRFEVDYRPDPYIEGTNAVPAIPSLYDYQLARRRAR